jgi:hypothetical protein
MNRQIKQQFGTLLMCTAVACIASLRVQAQSTSDSSVNSGSANLGTVSAHASKWGAGSEGFSRNNSEKWTSGPQKPGSGGGVSWTAGVGSFGEKSQLGGIWRSKEGFSGIAEDKTCRYDPNANSTHAQPLGVPSLSGRYRASTVPVRHGESVFAPRSAVGRSSTSSLSFAHASPKPGLALTHGGRAGTANPTATSTRPSKLGDSLGRHGMGRTSSNIGLPATGHAIGLPSGSDSSPKH